MPRSKVETAYEKRNSRSHLRIFGSIYHHDILEGKNLSLSTWHSYYEKYDRKYCQQRFYVNHGP